MLSLLHTLPPETRAALAATHIVIDKRLVAIVAAPSHKRASIEVVLDDDEIIAAIDDGKEFSLVIPEKALGSLDLLGIDLRIERRFRFLRLDVALPWTTVGYAAAIFAALAEAGVSAGMLSGFSNDYLLIPAARLDAARQTLKQLFAAARSDEWGVGSRE